MSSSTCALSLVRNTGRPSPETASSAACARGCSSHLVCPTSSCSKTVRIISRHLSLRVSLDCSLTNSRAHDRHSSVGPHISMSDFSTNILRCVLGGKSVGLKNGASIAASSASTARATARTSAPLRVGNLLPCPDLPHSVIRPRNVRLTLHKPHSSVSTRTLHLCDHDVQHNCRRSYVVGGRSYVAYLPLFSQKKSLQCSPKFVPCSSVSSDFCGVLACAPQSMRSSGGPPSSRASILQCGWTFALPHTYRC